MFRVVAGPPDPAAHGVGWCSEFGGDGPVPSPACRTEEDGTRTKLAVGTEERVDGWSLGTFRRIDFTHVRTEGRYRIEVATPDGVRAGEPFTIGTRRIHHLLLPARQRDRLLVAGREREHLLDRLRGAASR